MHTLNNWTIDTKKEDHQTPKGRTLDAKEDQTSKGTTSDAEKEDQTPK